MLSIRLTRTGKKKRPSYRFIVQDSRRDPWGKALEILGHRDPRTKETVINKERTEYWLGEGAQPSDSVWNILVDEKIVKGDKRGASHISNKRKGKLEEKEVAKKEKEVEAKEKAKAEKAAAEEEKAAQAEAPAEEAAPETSEEAPVEEKVEEAPAEEPAKEEVKEEAPAEEKKEEKSE